MRCVEKWYNVNDAFIFAVPRPLMDAFHHELISFLVHVAVELLPSPQSLQISWTDTSDGERAEHLSISVSFIVWYLTSVGLYLRSPCQGNDDDTAMSTVWDERAATCTPNLGGALPTSCGGDNLLGDGSGLTCLGQTDAQCGFSCHRSGNVGYQEPHGGAKVASYPGGASRWACVGLWASPWMQPDTVRSGNRAPAFSQSDGSVIHLTALITPSEQEREAKIKWWKDKENVTQDAILASLCPPCLRPLSSIICPLSVLGLFRLIAGTN